MGLLRPRIERRAGQRGQHSGPRVDTETGEVYPRIAAHIIKGAGAAECAREWRGSRERTARRFRGRGRRDGKTSNLGSP